MHNSMNIAPSKPVNTRELVIPNKFKEYFNASGERENSFIADSGPENDRILIFGGKDGPHFSLIRKYGTAMELSNWLHSYLARFML